MNFAVAFVRVLLVAAVLGSGVPAGALAGYQDGSTSPASSAADGEAPSKGHCADPSETRSEAAGIDQTPYDCCQVDSGCPHGGAECSCPAATPAVPIYAMPHTLRSMPSLAIDLRAAPPRNVVNGFLRPPRA